MGYIKLRKMVKKNNKLMILSLIALILVGGLFAGTHRANQILSGTFLGNYTFEGKVDFSNATLVGISSSSNTLNCSNLTGGSWILVPGNPELGTKDFCVMKYEAKQVNGLPKSQAANSPWVNIKQYEAYDACHNLGLGYHLITDEEWVTIARNAENTDASWTGGSVGSGMMFRGNVGTNDDAPYDGADPEASSDGVNDKGKLTLSNGEIIWDFSGNVWEWTQGQLNTDGSDLNQGEQDWNEWDIIYGNLKLGPYHHSYNATKGVGRVYTDNDGAYPAGDEHAFLRGGRWNNGAGAGAFALYLSDAPSNSHSSVGFRCSYAPMN